MMLNGHLNDFLGGHVLAGVHHVEAVVAEQKADDIFADIVHVTLHSGHDNDRPLHAGVLLHEGLQVRKTCLHGLRGTDELGQEVNLFIV